ncbi:MAG: type III-B CRISPR module-associated protein Cmr5 [Anaeromicrobium sp.]|jgi:CRISPR-associated protein Cmr5|uniref:type III-B CRISPR module-associated protein Cmr5 n=1 Tax=Anaeromicrobium sp. TaxID=1929132 RepID=UPI0025FC5CE7|nr:type III-B CRISPR module-associated protein Cmr5 [Anaeromicrobium sp.]MCT4594740.1 type III-B CRISPR module-associated protein Cmr5 [Anaeromicrobium sp.]
MNKKKIEEYIRVSISILDNPKDKHGKYFLRNKKDDKIPKEYKGYINSFGATVINSGLLATIAIYDNKSSGSEADKSQIIRILEKILNKDDLFNYAKEYKENMSIKRDIINASIALKLALRTYEFTD